MIFRIETETDGREVYCVEAATEKAAIRKFERGEAGKPVVAEVTGSSISSVCETTEDDC